MPIIVDECLYPCESSTGHFPPLTPNPLSSPLLPSCISVPHPSVYRNKVANICPFSHSSGISTVFLNWKKLFVGTVPTNKKLSVGTVPTNKKLFVGTVPMKKTLLVGTVPTDSFLFVMTLIYQFTLRFSIVNAPKQ